MYGKVLFTVLRCVWYPVDTCMISYEVNKSTNSVDSSKNRKRRGLVPCFKKIFHRTLESMVSGD